MLSFIDIFFDYISFIDNQLWSYVGVPLIILFGIYVSFKSGWIQLTKINRIKGIFMHFFATRDIIIDNATEKRGIHPMQAFFAAIGGCIGIGNVVGVCSAVQIGGPGAVLWMWVAALFGMLVKYCEIYLGIKYRVKNSDNSYDGGPMYFLKHVDKTGFLSKFFCFLMCIYGVEIYIFRIVTHTIVFNWDLNLYAVIAVLLFLTIVAGSKGVKTVGKISAFMIPLFLICFVIIGSWIFIKNFAALPAMFTLIFKSAFTGHAAVCGFAGSSFMMAISQGMKRACYAGDIGIGYASTIHAETTEEKPERQAALGIIGIFLDTFIICTLSVLLIILTGYWNQGIHESMVLATVFEQYIPYVTIIWPVFIFLLGYSTLIAFFAVGTKTAKILWPTHGKTVYTFYGVAAFAIFSFIGTEMHIMTIMSCTGVLLLITNLYGIFRLRNEISFNLPKQ